MRLKPNSAPRTMQAWRVLRLLAHLACGMLRVAFCLARMSPVRRDEAIRIWATRLLEILGVRVVASGDVPEGGLQRTLFIANHVSWLDIWLIQQASPVRFVAKSEVRHWPLIGWLARRTGTIFIERARRRDTGRTAHAMQSALQHGDCVCLFPEGTTTDGTTLQPFKTGLFQSAINAEATIRPVALQYVHTDGSINTLAAFTGETTLLQSLADILKQREITARLHFASPIVASGQERRILADATRNAIATSLHPLGRTALQTPAYPPDAVP